MRAGTGCPLTGDCAGALAKLTLNKHIANNFLHKALGFVELQYRGWLFNAIAS
jgi:hypothetical protein